MQCDHAQEFFSQYVTSEMDHALAVTLENHLNTCRPCRETVDGLRHAWTMLDEMPVVEPPPSFHSNIMERISAEQVAEDRPLVFPRPAFNWRTLFQPRTLAYAAVTLILLFGVEIIQSQRAALGPLGFLIRVLHPTPLLKTDRAEWLSNGLGGGKLTVYLQTHSQVNGAENHLHYHLQLIHRTGQSDSRDSRDGEISSEQETKVEMPLDVPPSATGDRLSVTLSPSDNTGDTGQTLDVPLTSGR